MIEVEIHPLILGLDKEINSYEVFPFRKFDAGNGLIICSIVASLLDVSPNVGGNIILLVIFLEFLNFPGEVVECFLYSFFLADFSEFFE